MQSELSSVGVNCYVISKVSKKWWKIKPKEIHNEHWMQYKEGRKVEINSIVTQSLDDGLRYIKESTKLSMRPYKAFFLQVQPNFIFHVKLVWHQVLIMELLIIFIGLL
jgi:hypothetical protein